MTSQFISAAPDRAVIPPHPVAPPRAGRSKFFARLALALVCLTLGASSKGQAQPGPPEPGLPGLPRSLASRSGQFRVRAVPGPLPPAALANLDTNQNFTRLDPMLLTVSCERIKSILWRDLGLQGSWRGRIYVTVRPPASAADPVTIGSERFRDGWQYGVDLPSLVERMQYVRAIVQVLLLEVANRSATDHGAEIPGWVTEGFARRLLTSTNSEVEIILPPPSATGAGFLVNATMVSQARNDPLKDAHGWLRAASPLTFQELSWPTAQQLEGAAGAVYAGSAQLFLSELLELPDGPARLRDFLAELPRHYNWQLAFLRAFHNRFQRPLDVEKWWALQLAHFTGRSLTQTWSPEESWEKLDECVSSSVLVHTSTNALPMHAETKLQGIIRDFGNPSRQAQLLQEKARELDSLRLRLAPDLAALAADYRQVLLTYLQTRDRSGFLGFGKQSWRRHAANEALQQLDQLDGQRARLGSAPQRPATRADNRRPR